MRLPSKMKRRLPWRAALGVTLALSVLAKPSCGAATEKIPAHQWTSYLQVRGTVPEGEGGYLALRRLKAFGSGPVGQKGSYYIQFIYKDGNRSNTDGRLFLQDAWLKQAVAGGTLTLGQLKPPFGLERFISDTVLPLIDRSQATDRLVPNGSLGRSFARDLGLQWDGSLGSVGYSAGAFLGNGANETIHGIGPLLVFRLLWDATSPLPSAGAVPKGVSPQASARRFGMAAAVSWRRDRGLNLSGQLPGSGVLGYRRFIGRDVRETLGFSLTDRNATLQAEGFFAQYHSGEPGLPSTSATGGYVQAAYRWPRGWESAIRLETLNAGFAGPSADSLTAWTVGITDRLRGDREKLQLNYTREQVGGPRGSQGIWLLQYQRYLLD